MKTKAYRNGKLTARSYMKAVGNGFEVGFTYAGKTLFMGNFIHSSEATQWYGTMNREIRNFARRYKVAPRKTSATWYGTFLRSHLYTCYYRFCDRAFTRHTRTFQTAVNKNVRRFRQVTRHQVARERTPFLKAA
jgi:hypothetical protein